MVNQNNVKRKLFPKQKDKITLKRQVPGSIIIDTTCVLIT
jgi:hypothetical protein